MGQADVGHVVGVGCAPDVGTYAAVSVLRVHRLAGRIDDTRTAARASTVLALVGVVNIPIIHYSVVWWNTLHQGATVAKVGGPAMATSMLIPLLVMALAFKLYFVLVVLMRARTVLMERERGSSWVSEVLM